jgi:hypothetical protein
MEGDKTFYGRQVGASIENVHDKSLSPPDNPQALHEPRRERADHASGTPDIEHPDSGRPTYPRPITASF